MITRTIYIGNPAYIKLKDNQLKIICPKTQETKGSVSVEDIGVLLLDHFQITLSHKVIQQLMGNNTVIISCDAQHLPFGLMLPLYGHTEHSERVKVQTQVSEPLKKQLWKQTVECKIENQKRLLEKNGLYFAPMLEYLAKVKSGDSTNMEGIAAQHYWKYLISTDFIRDRFGEMPNNLLNFGYAVLRSTVARAIVETGLLPVLGIFHRNKYNPYCLADDLMEPYRPMVDAVVYEWIQEGNEENLTKDAKVYLLQSLTMDVQIDNKIRPLLVAIKQTVVSLYKCYTGAKRKIDYPMLL
ncbi:type II CRISPR-associated endonuclease Cas1 [Tenacibaculum sp. UWU-22]|uniref:type II CRISPR-associated endonuclease Cas1 n=1 Tax=Tenacibaculum sp. UWU-22 TaxID=3234187 RepID=UPI0034DAEBAC